MNCIKKFFIFADGLIYRRYAARLLICLVILHITLCAGCLGSADQPKFVSIFSVESNSGTLKDFELLDKNIVKLTFSGKISELKVHALRENSENKATCTVEKEEVEGNTVFRVKSLEDFNAGEKFKIEGSAKIGSNFLDFLLPFEGMNVNPAELIFTDLKLGDGKNPGYIKFKVTKNGNLFGLSILSAADIKKGVYKFPSAEVIEGETIVYHWNLPKDKETAIDEISSPNECTAAEAFKGERDFWDNVKRISQSKKINAVLLKSSEKGNIKDAVIFMFPKLEQWENADIEQAVIEAVAAGKWQPDSETENAIVKNITPSKWISRKNLKNITYSANDWVLKPEQKPTPPKPPKPKKPKKPKSK